MLKYASLIQYVERNFYILTQSRVQSFIYWIDITFKDKNIKAVIKYNSLV